MKTHEVSYPAPLAAAIFSITTASLRKWATGNMIDEGLRLDADRNRENTTDMRMLSFADLVRLRIFTWLISDDLHGISTSLAASMCNQAFDFITRGVSIAINQIEDEGVVSANDGALNGPWLLYTRSTGERRNKYRAIFAENEFVLRQHSHELYCTLICDLRAAVASVEGNLCRDGISEDVKALLGSE